MFLEFFFRSQPLGSLCQKHLTSNTFCSKVVHTAAWWTVRFSSSTVIKWRRRWWNSSIGTRLEGTVSRFLRTCKSMLHIKAVRTVLLPGVLQAALPYDLTSLCSYKWIGPKSFLRCQDSHLLNCFSSRGLPEVPTKALELIPE